MKTKTRIISILMIMMLIFTGMSFSSFAATPTKGTVYVNVTQDYAKAKKLLIQINNQRSKRGLRKVTLDKSLTTAAIQRAAEITMVIPTTSPHRRPDGRYAKTAHKLAVRENCAEGYFTGPQEICKTWMNSKAHKATILLKSARSCGIAYVQNPADKNIGYYVLIMSNSKARSKVTSSKKVSSTKTVVALAKYLKRGYFFPEATKTELNPGDTSTVRMYYFGPKTLDFSSPLINAKSFTWTSSDKSVATVSTAGKVTAVGPGTVTIRAKLKKGPSFYKSTTFTVSSYEENFDKLTDYMQSGSPMCIDGLGYGYEEGDIYIDSCFSRKLMGDSVVDPDTGEEIEVYEHDAEYVVAQESRLGEEVAFLCSYAQVRSEDKWMLHHHRTFMIVSKKEGKVDDTLTFIHDYMDVNDNCVYRLKATAPRGAVDIYNLPWEIVQDTTGPEIDYELINEQIEDLFHNDALNYLYNLTGVKLQHLGIKKAK